MIEGPQIRAARALLGIGQQELSTLAQVGINTVKRLEQSLELAGSVRTLWKIRTALEAAGVEFIPAEETKGPGVRLKHNPRGKQPKAAGRRRRSSA
jgi:transcriptional regulator with XRE-family HTH domain